MNASNAGKNNDQSASPSQLPLKWPLGYGQGRWRWGWPQVIAVFFRIFLGPLFLLWDLVAYLGFYVEEVTPAGRRAMRGLPSVDRTEDFVRGEMRDVVTVAGGALCGSALGAMFSAEGLSVLLYYFLVVFVLAGIVVFHRNSRRLVRLSSAGAWEPGVAPEKALKTLQAEWNRDNAHIIWPFAAMEGGMRKPIFKRCISRYFWMIPPSCTLVPVFLLWQSNSSGPNQEGILFAICWLLVNIASFLLSLWTSMSLGRRWTRRFYFRAVRLRALETKNNITSNSGDAEDFSSSTFLLKMKATIGIWRK